MNANRTIRLFVSSTFSDLKAERDALQREVFPRLKQLCLAKGLRFQAIDLRWGISDEAGRDNKTMRICLRELKRCQQTGPKPNFLILLGDRYGWRPLPETIPAVLFLELEKRIGPVNPAPAKRSEREPCGQRTMFRRQKIQIDGDPEFLGNQARLAKLLRSWYRYNENAVPPTYELQPREGRYQELDVWQNEVEQPLLEVMAHKAYVLYRIPVFSALLRENINAVAIGSSATEQEIIEGALKVPDAATHVRAFFRTIDGLPNPAPKDYVETGEPAKMLMDLKDRISEHIGKDNACAYRVPWHTDGINPDDLKDFCEQVWKQLSAVIEQQIAALTAIPPEEQEEQAHHDFGKERCRHFMGRKESLDRIAKYFRQGTGAPLAVVGPSGSGKSAFIAKCVADLSNSALRTPHSAIVTRFIGATPASSDLIQLLRNIVGEIRRRYPAAVAAEPKSSEEEKPKPTDSEIPYEINPLVNAFHEALQRPAADKPLVLFLDALDQLTVGNNAHSLSWLPAKISDYVRLVVSAALPADEGRDGPPGRPNFSEEAARPAIAPYHQQDSCATIIAVLISRFDAAHRVTLVPLTPADGEQMLANWLADAHRALQPPQRDAVLAAFAHEGSPLWLRTAAEEAARLASWELLPAFASTTQGLLGQVLDRLSREEEHGAKLVSRTLSYLACARHGLAEDEILDILSADKEVMDDFRRRSPNSPKVESLPVAVWVRLHGDLSFYLAEHQAQGASLLGFYHRNFLEAVTARGLAEREECQSRHQHLADYFMDCAKGHDTTNEWETDGVRGFAECVFHLTMAGQHEQAAGRLTNFPFLLHKLRVGLLEGVFEDYDMVRHEAPVGVARRLEIWADFFREKAYILRRGNDEWPSHKILLQLAVEHADDSPLTLGAERWIEEGQCNWMWMHRITRPPHVQKNPCLAVLEGHNGRIGGAQELADGRLLSWSNLDHTLCFWDSKSGKCLSSFEERVEPGGKVLALTDGRVLSWSVRTICIWRNERDVSPIMLEGHTEIVKAVKELADGRLLSWSHDKTLRLWDCKSGCCQTTLEGHKSEIWGATELNGGEICSWSFDKTVRLWDSKSGVCLTILQGHTGPVRGALQLADGRLLSWSNDHTLRLWDTQKASCLAILKGHSETVLGAIALTDGRLVSYSMDKSLRLWDCENGACLATLEGHTAWCIAGVLELASGRLLSWTRDDDDCAPRLWDSRTGTCLATLKGHKRMLNGVRELANGRLLSWASEAPLRLWDSRSGVCIATLEGHTGCVLGTKELADGRVLSWSDDDTLRLWDTLNGAYLATFERHASWVDGVIALADGSLLSWTDSPTVFKDDLAPRLWDSKSGRCLASLNGHTKYIIGAVELADHRLLTWSGDTTLRVWNNHSGTCQTILQGHTNSVKDAAELADGRLLSWSYDATLRLWDSRSGACLATLCGHEGFVRGALPLSGSRVLSWSEDSTLRLWNSQNGACLAILDGHSRLDKQGRRIGGIEGVLLLSDVRLLSWTGCGGDCTPRLWDSKSGDCLAILKGHREAVRGAAELPDGRILTWSDDNTLRLWNSQSGACLKTLAACPGNDLCALILSDGRLLSWSYTFDKIQWRRTTMLQSWDSQSGACVALVPENDLARFHPEWVVARAAATNPSAVADKLCVVSSDRTARLYYTALPAILSSWESDANLAAHCLLLDGTAVATLASGQVCILKLNHGQRRVSLAEAEALLMAESREPSARV